MNRRSLLIGSLAAMLPTTSFAAPNSRGGVNEPEDAADVFPKPDAIWQWSVPVPTLPDRRAYLWIPQSCKRVRGVAVALQNMLEKPLFERPAFRAVCAENDVGLLLVFPAHDQAAEDSKNTDHPKRSSLDLFLNPSFPQGEEDPKGAGEDLQRVLDALAEESSYTELRHVPLMPVGHSSAGSFVWHLYRWDPARIFAMLPFKTGVKDDGPEGIPVLMVESEWFDFGNTSNNVWSKGAAKGRNGGKCLFGYYVDIGSGHCNVSDDSIAMASLFLTKAVKMRIPADAPIDGPVRLIPVTAESGYLVDSSTFGSPDNKPVAYLEYKGDRSRAYWYLDGEIAKYAQSHVVAQLSKKPQQINFVAAGKAPSTDGGMYRFTPKFLADGVTFEINAAYLNETTQSDLYPSGTKLSSSGMPIRYRVNSGGLIQVGPNTFRVRPHSSSLSSQGNPWEPTIIGYTLGNSEFRPAERPAHATINIFNKTGQAQTLDFPAIADQRAGSRSPIPLKAAVSSGLPVDYFIVSGPAQIAADGLSLILTPIPPGSKSPVRVLVGAYQWGRSVEPQVQSVGPIVREFFVR